MTYESTLYRRYTAMVLLPDGQKATLNILATSFQDARTRIRRAEGIHDGRILTLAVTE